MTKVKFGDQLFVVISHKKPGKDTESVIHRITADHDKAIKLRDHLVATKHFDRVEVSGDHYLG